MSAEQRADEKASVQLAHELARVAPRHALQMLVGLRREQLVRPREWKRAAIEALEAGLRRWGHDPQSQN